VQLDQGLWRSGALTYMHEFAEWAFCLLQDFDELQSSPDFAALVAAGAPPSSEVAVVLDEQSE
jgi:hypothetical protein